MTSMTKKQSVLAKAPAHVKARIMGKLADVRTLLANGMGKVAAQQMAYAKALIEQASSNVPQAIKWHKEVSSVSVAGTGKGKRYIALTINYGIVSGNTAASWLAELENKKERLVILGGCS